MQPNWRNILQRTALNKQSTKRREQNKEYLVARQRFLAMYPRCAECGKPATDVHHSAVRREGLWLLLQRYWIPLCRGCHDRAHKSPASYPHLFVRIHEDYRTHVAKLVQEGIDLDVPLHPIV